MNKAIVAGLFFVGVLAIASIEVLSTSVAQSTKFTPASLWEYKILNLSDRHDKWEVELNKAGNEGWELASSVPEMLRDTMTGVRMVLKRSKK